MERFFKDKVWIRTGLFFGFLMFLIVATFFTILRWKMMSLEFLLINLIINLLGGLLYSFLMRLYFKWMSRFNK